MRMKIDVIIPIVKRYMRMLSVRVLSMVSTSREKRFVMRPRGVVSKNDIGARKVRMMAALSITLEDFVPRRVMDMEKEKTRRAWITPKPA